MKAIFAMKHNSLNDVIYISGDRYIKEKDTRFYSGESLRNYLKGEKADEEGFNADYELISSELAAGDPDTALLFEVGTIKNSEELVRLLEKYSAYSIVYRTEEEE